MLDILFNEEYARKMYGKSIVDESSKAIWAVIRAIRNDWSDSDIREKYGVDQNVIDQTRAALQG